MPKTFEYKEVKIQIKYYKDFLSKLKKNIKFSDKYQKNLQNYVYAQYNSNYYSKLVEQAIKSENNNVDDISLKVLITDIYYYIESSKQSKLCNSIYSSYGLEIEKLLSLLSSGTNALFWVLTSNKKKMKAEKAYNELISGKYNVFVSSSEELLSSINSLKSTKFDDIYEMYFNNKEMFKTWLLKACNNIFKANDKVLIFGKYENEYKALKSKFSIVDDNIKVIKNDMKSSVDRLLVEELLSSLREVSVESLAKDKSGIKTKYLKDAGYENLADIYSSNVLQLSSIYGISEDKAYTIKSKCNSYVNQIKKDLKIKLSCDKKTKCATNVVKNTYIYLKRKEFLKKIESLDKEYGNKIENCFKKMSTIGCGIVWPFISEYEKNEIKASFDYVQDTMTMYKNNVINIINTFKNFNIIIENAWDDFADNSIKYFNAIEEVYPGVLGNDDSIYGLPQDLASEIQDECFFPDGLLCTLRKYQEWGVKYILHQGNVLLGDEMGLGKTIQAIAAMVSLKNTGATHFIVVCPASVVSNWCREIQKHSKLKATKIHGSNKTAAFKSWLKSGGVAVTNYESLSYINLDDNYKFSLLVVDEAHYIKKEDTKRGINTRELAKHADRLLLMTGTALENNIDEMISLIKILRPSIAEQVRLMPYIGLASQFRNKIAPVYYRRKRQDVLTELPEKIESKEWCTLNSKERAIYENSVLAKKYPEARRVSWNVDDLSISCKAQRMKEIVEEATLESRKILVFSFFRDTIAKIYDFFKGKCLNPINGSVTINRRQEILDEFDKAPAGTILLCQINSGGTGLNIQTASVVIICEPQFKPSIENQAISRVYRMGQVRNVLVYRLLCEDTVDERLIKLLEEKQKIFDAYADKSVAAQQENEISDLEYGKIINQEIEHIKKKNGIDYNLKNGYDNKEDKSNNKDGETNLVNTGEKENPDYYNKIMKMSYAELVKFLLDKYGQVKFDYFINESCATKNNKITRTNEGLFCHHIDEDKAIKLSDTKYAKQNPFEYQKAHRLVYCNLLEHLLLHILIFEEPKNENANINEIQGIGGAVCYICKQLNDIYNEKEFKMEYMYIVSLKVKNDFESYIIMLRRLWKDLANDLNYSSLIQKEKLACGSDDNICYKVLNELQ